VPNEGNYSAPIPITGNA